MACPEALRAAMKRRDFLPVIAGATIWPLAARAQKPTMPVVGLLGPLLTAEQQVALFGAFRQGLADAGYVAGKNVAIEERFTSPELAFEAARELVRRNVNVIFASVPDSVVAARNATTSIPIVALDLESDPLAKGFIKSLARPGGNLTGMFLDLPELDGKQVELLKEIVPRLYRIAIFGIPGLNAVQFDATEMAVRALGLEAEIMEVRVADDFEEALAAARTRHVQAGILLSSPLVFIFSKQIGELAIAKRLPLISLFAEFPRAGGLIAYGPNMSEIFRRCGDSVAKILHGAKPSDLPIQRPERFDLVINLKTAATLGLDMPTQLQQLADEVIE